MKKSRKAAKLSHGFNHIKKFHHLEVLAIIRNVGETRVFNKLPVIFSLGFLLIGCVSTEQFRMNTDWVIGEKPRVNAIIVLEKKKGERDVDSS